MYKLYKLPHSSQLIDILNQLSPPVIIHLPPFINDLKITLKVLFKQKSNILLNKVCDSTR